MQRSSIRDFPDHATFREKSVTTCLVGQLRDFLSLTLCNKTNFDTLQLDKYDVFGKKIEHEKNLQNVFFSLLSAEALSA